MARKCASAAILATLRDPRVVTMPAAAQTLWIRIVTALQNSGQSGLRFGSEIMNRTQIALFIQIAETEIEQNLGRLVDRGLLAKDADGGIICPMLVQAVSRSEINRINGSKGGRPRKDGSPPGQRNMLLPIDGSADKTIITKNQTKTGSENGANGVHSTTYLTVESESKVSEEAETELAETSRMVLEAMGLDAATSRLDCSEVRKWITAGADRELILDVVSRRRKDGIVTLRYFSAAIAEAIAAKLPEKPKYEREWEKAYNSWEISGRGVEPMPNLADFRKRFAA